MMNGKGNDEIWELTIGRIYQEKKIVRVPLSLCLYRNTYVVILIVGMRIVVQQKQSIMNSQEPTKTNVFYVTQILALR